MWFSSVAVFVLKIQKCWNPRQIFSILNYWLKITENPSLMCASTFLKHVCSCSCFTKLCITTSLQMLQQMFFFLFLRFDVADRLFFSIEASFNSVLNSLNDCKEITPDFFCLPEFLVNMNGKLSTHL